MKSMDFQQHVSLQCTHHRDTHHIGIVFRTKYGSPNVKRKKKIYKTNTNYVCPSDLSPVYALLRVHFTSDSLFNAQNEL